MSPTPVREALLRLEAIDLIRRLSKTGAVAQEAAVKSCEIHAANWVMPTQTAITN